MNKAAINEISTVLYGTTQHPDWNRLPRLVKQQLMNKLGANNYTNIHDPRLYQDLERNWKKKQENRKQDILFSVKHDMKIECSICMETHNVDSKVTTLLCGHKFCSQCIFSHIERQLERTSCPLCRGCVFKVPTPSHQQPLAPKQKALRINEKKIFDRRQKRQAERYRKRQAKKNIKLE